MTIARKLLAPAVLAALTAAATPALAAVKGPDVASYQHPYGYSINWTGVAHSGASFAFVKATEGTGYVNPYFAKDWSDILKAGMVRGAYHFARPARPVAASATAQANYYLAQVGTLHHAGDLPAVLDLEVDGGLSPAELISWTRTWLQTVERATGRTPILYSYPYFWTHQMANSTAFARYPLWEASYSSAAPRLGGWAHWTFWQYSDNTTVPGIPGGGSVDMSLFNGSLAQLRALANGAGAGGGSPYGSLDAVDAGRTDATLSGYAADPDTSGSVTVHVYVDGKLVAGTTANRPADGSAGASAGGDDDRHGFQVTVPLSDGTHKVCAYALNVGAGQGNTELGCETVTAKTLPYGHLDRVARDGAALRASGWTIDPDTTGPVRVNAYLDGRLVAGQTAAGERPDVAAAFPDAGPDHGFDLTIAAGPGRHTVCVYAINTGLGTGNPKLGCASA